jgi:hypothetical protein
MKCSQVSLLAGVCLLLSTSTKLGAQTLTHRYSFNDTVGSTNAIDSVGGSTWNGTLLGTASFDGSSLQLDGGGWVTLPLGLITNYTQVSVEFWASYDPNNANWTRTFAFGDQDGSGSQTDGLDYTHLAPGNYQNLHFSAPGGDVYANNNFGLNGQTNVHVTVILDPPNNRMLYYNGTTLLSSPVNGGSVPSLSPIADTVNLIGKSLFDVDPLVIGSINEFRVYNGALSFSNLVLNDTLGPDNYFASPGTLLAIHLTSPDNPLLVNQNSQQLFTGDFANVTGLNLSLYGGATFTSGNTNVLTVTPTTGLVKAIGVGTTTVIATYSTLSATNTLTVVSVPATLTHRYSFTSDANDSVGTANGVLQGSATVSGGKLVLDGTPGTYLDLPADNINIATNKSITIEAWVTFGDTTLWARLFDFGADGGSSEIYAAPTGPGNGGQHRGVSENFPDPGQQTIDWKGAWTNLSAHITFILDPPSSTLAVYRDGILEFARYDANHTLSGIATNLAVIGRSLVGADPYLPASIDEFRIYSGALSPAEIALTQINGPNSTTRDPGALNSIKVVTNTYPAYSGIVPPLIRANYANLPNFNLVPNNSAAPNTLIVTSSDTNVIQVLPNNMLRTLRPGIATLTATFQGKTDSATVSVQNIATLTHRYNFNTDASDSVGTADGTLLGDANVSGGSLVLDGIPGTYVELPPGLLEGYPAVTVDAWITFNTAQTWARLWYFGDDRADEFYIAPSVNGGSAHRFSTGITLGGNTLDRSPRFENQTLHVTGVFGNGNLQIYTNGVLEAADNANSGRVDEVGNWFSWIGRSPYADPYVNANVDEFRIYRGRLAPDEIQAADILGPNQLPTTSVSVAISRSAGNVTLSWPLAAAGFSVQTKPTLIGPWTTLTNAPTLVGNNWQVTVTTTNTTRFFRLWR